MKNFACAVLAVSLTMPFAAQAQVADRMTQEQLIQYAIDLNVCEDRSVDLARYLSETDNRFKVTCATPEGAIFQSDGLVAGLGGTGGAAVIVGLGVAALAIGLSSSSSDTQ
jgi:hypothetical protein